MIDLEKAQAAYDRLSVQTSFPGSALKPVVPRKVYGQEKSVERQKAWELLLRSGGRLTLTEVAKLVGVSRQSVSKWCREDKWREQLADVFVYTATLEQFHRDVETLKELIGPLKEREGKGNGTEMA